VNQTKNKKKGRENEEEEEGKSTIMEKKKIYKYTVYIPFPCR
jgi:hypothetical protein